MPPISVLIKPASGKCNLRCEYCFYEDIAVNRSIADFGFMTPETLETIVRKVMAFADGQATFSFQGGEPTLRGLDFYRMLIDLQKKYNTKNVTVSNCIQTNGVLLDEEWAEFLHDNGFLVGLSLDGPQKLHDLYRKDAVGGGTYTTVMQKARLLKKYGVDFNILLVVTGATTEDAGKTYAFFQKNGFNYLQFIPCIDPLAEKRGGYSFSLRPAEYTRFLKRFFDRWSADILSGTDVSVRYFDNLVRMIMGMPPETCSMRGICSCQFVFEADGTCYPCDFYVTENWRLGNIHEMGIMNFYESKTNQRFLDMSKAVADECRRCKWQQLCRGGCRRDREDALAGAPGKNYFCQSFYSFFDYAYPRLKEIAHYIIRQAK